MTKEKISSFGGYLRNLREGLSLPLRKVAAELDIDPSLLAKIERNERRPNKELVRSIAKLFKEDEQKLIIEFLSDVIAYQVFDEEDGMEVLKVAEEKVKYYKKTQKKSKKQEKD